MIKSYLVVLKLQILVQIKINNMEYCISNARSAISFNIKSHPESYTLNVTELNETYVCAFAFF